MNTNNISYAVARATAAARESGEIQYVGYWRCADSFCPTTVGTNIHSQVEWRAAVDWDGLVNFDDEDEYAQWALTLERAHQAHIASAERSGNASYFDAEGNLFLEV